MQNSDLPALISLPFANDGIKNEIPENGPGVLGQATLRTGFPPETMLPITQGGIPPGGADFNGILNLITSATRWNQAGGTYRFNEGFCESIGGYPKGAILNSAQDGVVWFNEQENNFTDPDSGSAIGWTNLLNTAAMQQALADAVAAASSSESEASRSQVEADRSEAGADRSENAADLAQASSATVWRATFAALTSAMSGKPAETPGVVYEDGANQGYWVWNGSSLLRSALQPASNAELADVASRVIQVGQAAGFVPVVVAGGRVILWMENGSLSGFDLSDRLKSGIFRGKLTTLAAGAATPLAVSGGKIVAWFDAQGAFGVSKLSAPLVAGIQAGMAERFNPRFMPKSAETPIVTDGRGLFRPRARLATLKSGVAGKVKVAFTGDSWTAQVKIPLAVGAEFDAAGITKASPGWISTLPGDQMPGVVMTRVNWQSETVLGDPPTAPTYGVGLDGANINTSGTNATVSITAQFGEFRIFYRNNGGTFRYQVDGGAFQTVSLTSDGSFGVATISGLPNSSHTVFIDTVPNSGVVVLTGYYATNSESGYELIKVGIGGAAASNIRLLAPFAQDFVASMAPDLLVFILGTNDYRRASGSVVAYRQAILETVAAYRLAVPDIGVVLMAPAISNGIVVTPLAQFRTAMYEIAIENGWEFLSLYDTFGPFPQANSLGMWDDTLHLSAAGARQAAGLLNSKLLEA